ncbi:uncharacterized protein LOC135122195 isoform X2 [Zophobas morio]|uniref:uncharacterized protein LOC135122195 isoform X2 n=1 Tax=Zophobas morio TaxID=2755281 RepID=UPI0030828A2B
MEQHLTSKKLSTNLEWVFFVGDVDSGINSLLHYFTGQRSIRELQKYQPKVFMQRKQHILKVGDTTVNLLLSSHGSMDVTCPDRLSRQLVFQESYYCSLVIMVFDITKKATFLNAVRTYVPELLLCNPDASIVMLALGAESRSASLPAVQYQEASYFVECFDLHGYFEAHSIRSVIPFYLVDTMIENCIAASMSRKMQVTRELFEGNQGKPTESDSVGIKNKEEKKRKSRYKHSFGTLRKRMEESLEDMGLKKKTK